MSWSLRLTGKKLGTVRKKMSKPMLNLLELKNSYLIGGPLQKKIGSDHVKVEQLMLVEEFKRCIM